MDHLSQIQHGQYHKPNLSGVADLCLRSPHSIYTTKLRKVRTSFLWHLNALLASSLALPLQDLRGLRKQPTMSLLPWYLAVLGHRVWKLQFVLFHCSSEGSYSCESRACLVPGLWKLEGQLESRRPGSCSRDLVTDANAQPPMMTYWNTVPGSSPPPRPHCSRT